jgi:hypothetical protein
LISCCCKGDKKLPRNRMYLWPFTKHCTSLISSIEEASVGHNVAALSDNLCHQTRECIFVVSNHAENEEHPNLLSRSQLSHPLSLGKLFKPSASNRTEHLFSFQKTSCQGMAHSKPPRRDGDSSPRTWLRLIQALLLHMPLFACICAATALPATAALVTVDPQAGSDTVGCGEAATPCKTIVHAVQNSTGTVSSIRLTAGVFNGPTVNIIGMTSLSISGVPLATVFDCSRRLQPSGAEFFISNSTVIITGITF